MSKTIDLPFTPEEMAAGRVADTADILVRLRRFNSVTMEDAAKEIERLRLRLSAILTWTENWNCPWEGEEEWRGDVRLAKAALRGEPD